MKERILLIGLAIVVSCVVGGFLIHQQSVTSPPPRMPRAVLHEPAPPAPAPEPILDTPLPPTITQLLEPKPPVEPPRAQPPPPPPPRPNGSRASASTPTKSSARPARELHDPIARVALIFVGTDRDAEEYWLNAIFDPTLPNGKEREDLMEDLNEVGFDDPRHPGPDDIPLILSRLEIIEEVAPYGDEFMLEHLGEAYKDLVNMYSKASE